MFLLPAAKDTSNIHRLLSSRDNELCYFQQAALRQERKINLLECRGKKPQYCLKISSHFLLTGSVIGADLKERTPFESCGALVLYKVTSG